MNLKLMSYRSWCINKKKHTYMYKSYNDEYKHDFENRT